MNYLNGLYNWFRPNRNVNITEIDESQYRLLQNTCGIHRLIVDYMLIKDMDYFANIYGKLNCKICTISTNFIYVNHDVQKQFLYKSGIMTQNDSGNDEPILLNFVNAEIIDICDVLLVHRKLRDTNGEEVLKFRTNIEAKVYVGCEPIEERSALILARLSNGGILDQEGKLITLDKTLDLLSNSRFAKTKSAKN
jgi:hypothetical protein